jgi:hypothetical protein
LSLELGQRRPDRVAGHAQLAGQCAKRRQAIPGPKPTAVDIALNGLRDLPRQRDSSFRERNGETMRHEENEPRVARCRGRARPGSPRQVPVSLSARFL